MTISTGSFMMESPLAKGCHDYAYMRRRSAASSGTRTHRHFLGQLGHLGLDLFDRQIASARGTQGVIVRAVFEAIGILFVLSRLDVVKESLRLFGPEFY